MIKPIHIILIGLLTLLIHSGAFAQEKTQTGDDSGKQKQSGIEKVGILGEEDFVSEEEAGYSYKPAGRRDPFWDLGRGKKASKKSSSGDGIKGLEIEQLSLEGILKKKGEFIALLKGPDGKPYDVKVGQIVYDGEIIKIDAGSVVFKKILTVSLGGAKESTIVIRLNPEDEKSTDDAKERLDNEEEKKYEE